MSWPSHESITKLAAELYEIGLHSVGPDDLDNRQIAERLLVLWSLSAKREPVVMSKDATNAAIKKALARREKEARECACWQEDTRPSPAHSPLCPLHSGCGRRHGEADQLRAAHQDKPSRPKTRIDGDDTWDLWPA